MGGARKNQTRVRPLKGGNNYVYTEEKRRETKKRGQRQRKEMRKGKIDRDEKTSGEKKQVLGRRVAERTTNHRWRKRRR